MHGRWKYRTIACRWCLSIILVLVGAAPVLSQDRSTSTPTIDELFTADQEDRGNNLAASRLASRDSIRRAHVEQLLENGRLTSSEDYFRAAVIFQHGNRVEHFQRAHQFAAKAVDLDSTNTSAKWLMAATRDRLRLSQGKPQIYGTQFVVIDGTWYLRELDSTVVSDAERRELNVRTLGEIRDYLRERNDTSSVSLRPPEAEVSIK